MLVGLNNSLKIDLSLFIEEEYLNLETLKYMQIVQNILKVKQNLEINDLWYQYNYNFIILFIYYII